MHEPIQVQGAPYPKAFAELYYKSRFLMVLSLLALPLALLMVGLCLLTVRKPPLVLAFSESGVPLQPGPLPKADDEVREALRAYLAMRYRWSPRDISAHLQSAEGFISGKNLKVFRVSMTGVIQFALQRQIGQRVYPNQIDINLPEKTAHVTGDRITTALAVRAATPFNLFLKFDYGTRTLENPWGIYVVQEKEAEAQ